MILFKRTRLSFINKIFPVGLAIKDFWRYDPLTNVWTQIADFGGEPRAAAVGFTIGSKGYMGTGQNFCNCGPGALFNDFWEYDPSANAWTQKRDFGGSPRLSAVGF